MRIDKYLKVARIIKRRTLSKEIASNERVVINGKISKPSSEVKVNDIVEITFGNRILIIKVLNINDVVRKNDAEAMYEVIEEKKLVL